VFELIYLFMNIYYVSHTNNGDEKNSNSIHNEHHTPSIQEIIKKNSVVILKSELMSYWMTQQIHLERWYPVVWRFLTFYKQFQPNQSLHEYVKVYSVSLFSVPWNGFKMQKANILPVNLNSPHLLKLGLCV